MGLTVADTGVIIAWLDGDDPFHAAATSAVSAVHDRRDRLVIPASAYAELLVRPTANGTIDTVTRALGDNAAAVEHLSPPIATTAAALRARHGRRVRLPDALVIATAMHLDADHLVTTDDKWPTDQLDVRHLHVLDAS